MNDPFSDPPNTEDQGRTTEISEQLGLSFKYNNCLDHITELELMNK